MAKKIISEKLIANGPTKTIYNFINSERGIDQKSKEVYKKGDVVVHFPIGYEGGNKYKNIESLRFTGFKSKLPVGVNKTAIKGYGFTRSFKPLAKYIDEVLKVKKVLIFPIGTISFNKTTKELKLTEVGLKEINQVLSTIYKKNTEQLNAGLLNILYKLLPGSIKKPQNQYVANALSVALQSWGNKISDFTPKDKESIKDLFDKLSLTTDFLTNDALKNTKILIDNKYIAETIKKFKTLLKSGSNSKIQEKKWQSLFKENSWIFSSIFAHPVMLFQDEAYVGGKSFENKDGKFSDFLIKNSLSNNVSFLEIKTAKTLLLEKKPYRGTDVFSCSKELTGSISQVLNQRDNFQKEFANHKLKNPEENFETFNSKCVVLIGSLMDLTKKQKAAFELLRSNSRDAEIITFDELLFKVESLQSLMLRK